MSKFQVRPALKHDRMEIVEAPRAFAVVGDAGLHAVCFPEIAHLCAASPLMLGTLRRVQQMMRRWPIEDGSEQYVVAVAVDNAIKAAEGKPEDAS